MNYIFKEEIFPIGKSNYLNKGIIIRHKDVDNYQLYTTKLKSNGEGNEKFFYFEDNYPYCKGVENIKSFLKNKGNTVQDKFITINGRIKLFNFFILNNIEFINADIDINDNEVYDKILEICSLYIYIIDSQNLEENIKKIISKCLNDKKK